MTTTQTTEPITTVVNKKGTEIHLGDQWRDDNPGRDPIRHFTITGFEKYREYVSAICHITHGIDRTTGARVPIDRVVKIDIHRLHKGRTGYQQVTPAGDAA